MGPPLPGVFLELILLALLKSRFWSKDSMMPSISQNAPGCLDTQVPPASERPGLGESRFCDFLHPPQHSKTRPRREGKERDPISPGQKDRR